jgi:hypothetical protein
MISLFLSLFFPLFPPSPSSLRRWPRYILDWPDPPPFVCTVDIFNEVQRTLRRISHPLSPQPTSPYYTADLCTDGIPVASPTTSSSPNPVLLANLAVAQLQHLSLPVVDLDILSSRGFNTFIISSPQHASGRIDYTEGLPKRSPLSLEHNYGGFIAVSCHAATVFCASLGPERDVYLARTLTLSSCHRLRSGCL